MLPPVALDNNKDWKLRPLQAEWLPLEITLGDDIFSLAGVTMYRSDHFTSLVFVDEKWHYYDGLHGGGNLNAIDFTSMKKLDFSLCNAYYLLK